MLQFNWTIPDIQWILRQREPVIHEYPITVDNYFITKGFASSVIQKQVFFVNKIFYNQMTHFSFEKICTKAT